MIEDGGWSESCHTGHHYSLIRTLQGDAEQPDTSRQDTVSKHTWNSSTPITPSGMLILPPPALYKAVRVPLVPYHLTEFKIRYHLI